MTQTTHHPKGGWKQEEIDLLFSAVQNAADSGRPLRDVFADVGQQLSRKPNSIRNFYYARVREMPELAARQAPFRSFSDEELHQLLRHVLISRGQGQSVRACVTQLAGGDRAGMLRYQNKYRSILKNKPEMLLEVAEELRAEGLPCPQNVAACRRYERTAKTQEVLGSLEDHMGEPAVRAMVENLLSLIKTQQEPSRKWEEIQRENDRLKVEVDLLRMALEDARDAR
ncbi:MAG: hypothetical protein PUD16_08250 [bacterium]|nr:hypothetical protein [bacterium]